MKSQETNSRQLLLSHHRLMNAVEAVLSLGFSPDLDEQAERIAAVTQQCREAVQQAPATKVVKGGAVALAPAALAPETVRTADQFEAPDRSYYGTAPIFDPDGNPIGVDVWLVEKETAVAIDQAKLWAVVYYDEHRKARAMQLPFSAKAAKRVAKSYGKKAVAVQIAWGVTGEDLDEKVGAESLSMA